MKKSLVVLMLFILLVSCSEHGKDAFSNNDIVSILKKNDVSLEKADKVIPDGIGKDAATSYEIGQRKLILNIYVFKSIKDTEEAFKEYKNKIDEYYIKKRKIDNETAKYDMRFMPNRERSLFSFKNAILVLMSNNDIESSKVIQKIKNVEDKYK